MAKIATIYANVGDDVGTIDNATSSLISTMKGFELEAEDARSIVDKLNEVGKSIAQQYGNILKESGYIGQTPEKGKTEERLQYYLYINLWGYINMEMVL